MAIWDKARQIHLRLRGEQEGRQRRMIKALTEHADRAPHSEALPANDLPDAEDQGAKADPMPVSEEPPAKREVYDEASMVETDAGNVAVDGPDGVAVSLTPEAALETGQRLIEKSGEAAAQHHWETVAARRCP